jgi:hypothetical protein
MICEIWRHEDGHLIFQDFQKLLRHNENSKTTRSSNLLLSRNIGICLPSRMRSVSLGDSQPPCLILHNIRQQVFQLLLRRLPPKQLIRPLRLAQRVGSPEIAAPWLELIGRIFVEVVDLRAVNELLVKRELGDFLAEFAPAELPVFGEVVALVVPGCFATVGAQRTIS